MLDALTPQNIAIAAATTVPVLFGLRYAFGRAVLSKARDGAAAEVEAFKTTTPFIRLTPQQKENAGLLESLLDRAQGMSSHFKKQADTLSTSKLGKRDPKREIIVAGVAVGAVMANIATNKLTSLLDVAIQRHMAKEAGNPVAEIALSPLSQEIIHVFDELGVTAAGAALEQALAEHVSQQTMETIGHVVSDILTPGLLAAGVSAHREITMLINGQVTFDEMLTDGLAPTAGRFGLVLGGIKTDIATGGATMGLGTLGGIIGGLFFYDWMVKSNLDKEKTALSPYVHKIDTRRDQAATRVNQAIDAEYATIKKLIESHPKLNDDRALLALLREASSRFSTDTEDAIRSAERGYAKIIAGLPERTWVDKVLGVDRSAEVEGMYAAAKAEKINSYRAAATAFSTAMRLGPKRAAATLRESEFVRGGRAISLVSELQTALLPIAQAHDQQLQTWSQRCNDTWISGRDTIVRTNEF